MEGNYPGETITISGDIASVVYTNEENGYSVIEVDLAEGGRITAVGTIPYPGEGETITAEGVFINHPTFGSQFKCKSIERIMPSEANAILKYLCSGAIKGIGIATARKIVSKFGTSTFDVIANNPEFLTDIKGITLTRAKNISAELTSKFAVRELVSFLSEYGLEMPLAVSVYKKFGPAAREVITRNPYFLALEPFLADFRNVDAMALSLGFGERDFARIEAGIIFELYINENEGHVFLPYDRLVGAGAKFLDLPETLIADTLDAMIEAKTVKTDTIGGLKACYITKMYEAEVFTAQRLIFLASRRFPAPPGAEKAFSELEKEFKIEYSEKQREAILAAVREPVMVLTGGPGTGKTTAVRGMIGLLERMGTKTLIAAPTGRAAKRLTELCGREAKTIHRLLEVVFSENNMVFARNLENPLDADAVIIDELSMVDLPLMASLLAALKNSCRLIMVGDPDQLPSVGPGTVLNDIIKSGRIKRIHLDEIFRQARESDIIMNAHAVNRGEMPSLKNNKKDFFFLNRRDPGDVVSTVAELCAARLPGKMGFQTADIQVITPTRQGFSGVYALNPILRDLLNPPSPSKKEKAFGNTVFREGDRVMQIKNNYDIVWNREEGEAESAGTGVFNGDMGVIKKINPLSETVTVEFVDKSCDYSFDMLGELEHAYAITVHKAQGSEFRAVVFVAALSHSRLLNRNLFYTAITRARELFIIVGNPECIETMVGNKQKLRRYSGLKERIEALSEGREVC